MRSSVYHRLPIAEKRAVGLARIREQPRSCPRCGTLLMTADLLAHLDYRCSGPREPGPGSRWLTWRAAITLGVKRQTLANWVANGLVRVVGERMDRRYLEADLVYVIAIDRVLRRR